MAWMVGQYGCVGSRGVSGRPTIRNLGLAAVIALNFYCRWTVAKHSLTDLTNICMNLHGAAIIEQYGCHAIAPDDKCHVHLSRWKNSVLLRPESMDIDFEQLFPQQLHAVTISMFVIVAATLCKWTPGVLCYLEIFNTWKWCQWSSKWNIYWWHRKLRNPFSEYSQSHLYVFLLLPVHYSCEI